MTDRRCGTLRVGAATDIAVLERAILLEDPSAITGIRVALAVVGGEIVHRTEELA
jgi:predicted amidohydrolase YtcJ